VLLARHIWRLSPRLTTGVKAATWPRRLDTEAPILRGARSDPRTNLNSAPNLAAAVSAEKYTLGIENSTEALGKGEPATYRKEVRTSEPRKSSV